MYRPERLYELDRRSELHRSVVLLSGDDPAASGSCDEHIARVQVADIDNSSGCDGYRDYSAISTTVVFPLAYPLIVTNGVTYHNSTCSVWVDWNQDKIFEDTPPELLGRPAVGRSPQRTSFRSPFRRQRCRGTPGCVFEFVAHTRIPISVHAVQQGLARWRITPCWW